MNFFESLLLLLAVAIVLLQVSRRLTIPYPTMLAAAGVGLALIPGAPPIKLDPHIALALFIAPAPAGYAPVNRVADTSGYSGSGSGGGSYGGGTAPAERKAVRENFARAQKKATPPGQRAAEWEQYQQLPEEAKKALADAAAAKNNQVAKTPTLAQSTVKTPAPVKAQGHGLVPAPGTVPPGTVPPAPIGLPQGSPAVVPPGATLGAGSTAPATAGAAAATAAPAGAVTAPAATPAATPAAPAADATAPASLSPAAPSAPPAVPNASK